MTPMTPTHRSAALTSVGLRQALASLPFTTSRLPMLATWTVAWLVLAASAVVYAEERVQDWIPGVLTIPTDAEVVKNRIIGSSVRMFSTATDAEVDGLFSQWEESLSANGYSVAQGTDRLMERVIEFSGPGISNAKILVAPSANDGRNVIQFDATLD